MLRDSLLTEDAVRDYARKNEYRLLDHDLHWREIVKISTAAAMAIYRRKHTATYQYMIALMHEADAKARDAHAIGYHEAARIMREASRQLESAACWSLGRWEDEVSWRVKALLAKDAYKERTKKGTHSA